MEWWSHCLWFCLVTIRIKSTHFLNVENLQVQILNVEYDVISIFFRQQYKYIMEQASWDNAGKDGLRSLHRTKVLEGIHFFDVRGRYYEKFYVHGGGDGGFCKWFIKLQRRKRKKRERVNFIRNEVQRLNLMRIRLFFPRIRILLSRRKKFRIRPKIIMKKNIFIF